MKFNRSPRSQREAPWRVQMPRESEEAYLKYATRIRREQLRRQGASQRRQVPRADRSAEPSYSKMPAKAPRPEGCLRALRFAKRSSSAMVESETSFFWPVRRSFTSTLPSARPRLPMTTCSGQPIRSASANFTPARSLRSSMTTSKPKSAISLASFSAAGCTSSSPTVSGIMHT